MRVHAAPDIDVSPPVFGGAQRCLGLYRGLARRNAVRALCIGGETATWVIQSVLWSVGIVAVFAPLAVRRYRQVT